MITSDQGREFVNTVTEELFKKTKTKHRITSAYHPLQCIQNQHFTPFPCTVINKRPQAGHQQVVPLFCQCRQLEGGKMAQCDGCKEWYHDECANFPDDIESVAWFCPSC